MPLNLNNMQRVAPSPQHGALAAARLPFIPAQQAAAALQQAAGQLGMSSIGANQYQHTDGSWVGLVGNRVERGFGSVIFQGRPADFAAMPVAAVGAAAGHAVAQIPPTSTNTAQVQADLLKLGFVQPDPNIAYYSHPDASWAAIMPGGQIERGFGGQRMNPSDVPAQQAPAQQQPAPAQAAQATPAAPAAAPAFKADDVLAYQKVNATFEDNFVAAAAVNFLQPQNLANDRNTFLQMGFTEKAPGYFEHKDGSFLSYTTRNTIERGRGQQLFARNPTSPVTGRLAVTAPTWNQVGLAAANPTLAALQPADVLDGKNKALLAAGFTETRPGFWHHQDGSFVAAAANNVYFGHNQQVFSGPPNLQTLIGAMPQIAVDAAAVQNAVLLWSMPATTAGATKHLKDLGFTEQSPGYFVSGQLWVAVSPNDQIQSGTGQGRYPNVPTPSHLPQVQSNPIHQWNAIAQTHKLAADTATLVADLQALGFTAVANNNLFTHPDGSWLAVTAGKLVRGHGGNVFTDVPQPPPPGAQRPFPQFSSVPPGTWHDWAHVHGFACARLPVWGQLNQQQCTTVLSHLGFIQQDGAGFWKHPDGSEVHLNWTQVPTHRATKFQAFDFGQFPYNRQVAALPNTQGGTRSWNEMTQDTQRWVQWVQNPSASQPPWPAFGTP